MESTKQCSNCGRPVAPTARYCSHCGEKQGDLRARDGTGLLPPNKRLHGDRYLVIRKLAQGGQSAVYLAMDTASGERVAVKELSEAQLTEPERVKAVNDFLREAAILRGLRHPYLCRVIETFLEEYRKPFLVMEYIEGHNLEDELIDAGRPLDWPRVAQWGILLADVLGYLHEQTPPIIYRDLKPANVMLTPAGAIKLIDFGIARELQPHRRTDTARLGTDGYAPLEQYNARSEPRSDLYALGASLYHLLTGRVPDAAPVLAAGHPLTPIRAINPAVPDTLDRVILQALNRNPQDRFQNALAMRQALEWACQPRTPPGASLPAGRLAGGVATGATGAARSGPASQANGSGLPPRLRVWPLRLDVGLLETNQTSVQTLECGNRGGGALTGVTETNSASLVVAPRQVDAGTTQIQVQVNATGLAPGEYVCHLAVRTNGGDQIVPVRFMVRPAGGVPSTDWTQQRR
jgi:serine/threonine-protein kinase